MRVVAGAGFDAHGAAGGDAGPAGSCGKVEDAGAEGFVTAQLAISMALLMATGLLVKTLAHLGSMDMGFSSHENAVLVVFTGGKEGAQRGSRTGSAGEPGA